MIGSEARRRSNTKDSEGGTAGRSGLERRYLDSPVIVENKWWEWLFALFLYVCLFLVMFEYHRWRSKPYSLFTANKSMAIAAMMLIAVSLSMGPLYRLTGRLRKWIRLRRPLGLVAVVFMVPHVIISLFFLPDRFDFDYYMDHWPSLLFAVPATLGFFSLFAISNKWGLRRLGRARWKAYQRWGYLFLAIVLVHFILMGKIPNWIRWYKTLDQPVPPGTSVAFTFGSIPLFLRAIDRYIISKKMARTSRPAGK